MEVFVFVTFSVTAHKVCLNYFIHLQSVLILISLAAEPLCSFIWFQTSEAKRSSKKGEQT